ncbi:MAG TPA: sigma-70 family RNA polymerase sigma factor [Planctomycetota bacterium]|nr:sigma-70 family RNA polymerase sigma factor [Planctomycetota bacterium]
MDFTDPEWDERILRAAVLAGDGAAWRTLHDRFFDPLYAYIHCRTGRRADLTEDVVQECWLTAVRRIRDFDPGRGAFEVWLRGIALNVLRNHHRGRRREASLNGAPGAVPRDDACPERPVELSEEIAIVLTGLPVRQQEVLVAKYEEGLSVEEIAARWGESWKAVESLLARARAAFRDAYARRQLES